MEHQCNFSEARQCCVCRLALPGRPVPPPLRSYSLLPSVLHCIRTTSLPPLLPSNSMQVIITQGIEVKTKTQNKKCKKPLQRVRGLVGGNGLR